MKPLLTLSLAMLMSLSASAKLTFQEIRTASDNVIELFYISDTLDVNEVDSPDQRKKGYGALLLSAVVDAMKKEGPFRLCDCVSKKNLPSLKTHEKCGFRIVSEEGYDYLLEETDDRDFGLEYRYPEA